MMTGAVAKCIKVIEWIRLLGFDVWWRPDAVLIVELLDNEKLLIRERI